MTDTAAFGNVRSRPLSRSLVVGLVVGVVGLALCVLGLLGDPVQFFRSYLFAYLFWLGISFGCLVLLLTYHIAGGGWGDALCPILQPAALTLPLMAILFIPLVFGMRDLYLWARPEAVAADPLLQHKEPYLNVPFFLIRAVIYLVAWSGLAYVLRRWSLTHGTGERLPRLSGLGLILLALTATFAMIDWVMSLEPHWYSTIYAAMVVLGGMVSAFAFAVLVRLLLANVRAPVPDRQTLNDLGSLLLAFVMGWAYLAFSQYLVIWAGNLDQEIPWYVRRLQGGWELVALFVTLFHFVLPFVLLLSRSLKRNPTTLGAIAALLLVTGVVDTFWVVTPAFYPNGFHIHWLDVAALVGIGGLWIALFAWVLRRQSMLTLRDSAHEALLQEVAGHG